ncbi:MAG: prolyl oligopeptidase family serine peptidase, partial [Candidatus Kapabacteria bacterium]|nr:prolyl oligopeptidase family serine peptidase [Candidatus Kapabacteria bacterium]MDW7997002.1 prolyl oligopeptidase family serine peptidase [Bacteroidota bacterium]
MPAPPRIPLRDFFRNPERAAFTVSPDGNYLAWLAPVQHRMNLFVLNRRTGEECQLTEETERDISAYEWANNHLLLYARDTGGDENFRLALVDAAARVPPWWVTPEGARAGVVDPLRDRSGEALITTNERRAELFDVYRLLLPSGERELVVENPGNVVSWLTDHDGQVRAAVAVEGTDTSLLFRSEPTEPFRTVLTVDFRTRIEPLFFSFDNQRLYALSNRGRDRLALVLLDLETGEETVVFEHPEVDVAGAHYSRKRKLITHIHFVTWKREYVFPDPWTAALYERLQQELGEYEIVLVSHDCEEQLFVVRTYSDRSLGAYWLYDVYHDRLQKLADLSPWLQEEWMAPMRPIQYRSRDGWIIHGYLTLPIGLPPKNLPVVVHPHGGPWVRDTWGFNPIVQFLANRGYAIFQMNFRGSTGYGRAFWEASFKQWGRAMQNDITDGVLWLLEQRIADPKRIAIYGGSYGGYAVLAGLAFTPELYACGVDFVGVSNLLTFMQTIPPYWEPLRPMLYAMVGDPEKEADYLREVSPVFY